MPRRLLRWLPLLAGAAVLFWLIWSLDGPEVVRHILGLGWSFLIILQISFLWKCVNAGAWLLAFPRRDEAPTFFTLFVVNLAGDVINNIVPSGNVGGEVAKPYLLDAGSDRPAAAASVIANKTMEILAGLMFAAAGVTLSLIDMRLAPPVRVGLVLSVVVAGAVILVLCVLQRRRILSSIALRASRTKLLAVPLSDSRTSAERVDTYLATFYDSGRWLPCLALRLLSFGLGTLETYLILKAMIADAPLSAAFLLFSLALVIDTAFCFVPGNIGTYEAGHTYLLAVLGMPPSVGLAVAFVKRIRRIIWMGIGTAVLHARMTSAFSHETLLARSSSRAARRYGSG